MFVKAAGICAEFHKRAGYLDVAENGGLVQCSLAVFVAVVRIGTFRNEPAHAFGEKFEMERARCVQQRYAVVQVSASLEQQFRQREVPGVRHCEVQRRGSLPLAIHGAARLEEQAGAGNEGRWLKARSGAIPESIAAGVVHGDCDAGVLLE